MFAIAVRRADAGSVDLQIDAIHPDAGPVVASATMALMLIYEPIYKAAGFDKHPHLTEAALAGAMDGTNWLEPSWIVRHARAFIARVLRKQNVITVEPTHPAWTAHLRTGMRWESAAYDAGPGKAAAPLSPEDIEAAQVPSENERLGFRVGAPKGLERNADWDAARLKKAFIPRWGALRYVMREPISGANAMEQAVRTMIGQPLLVVPKKGPVVVGTLVEVRKHGVVLYTETPTGWGSSFERFEDVKSLGRAVAKQTAPTKAAATKAPAKKAASPPKKASAVAKATPSAKRAATVHDAKAYAPLDDTRLRALLKIAGLSPNLGEVKLVLLKATVYAGRRVLLVHTERPKRTRVLTTSTYLLDDEGLHDADQALISAVAAQLQPKAIAVCTPADDAGGEVMRRASHTGDIAGLVSCSVYASTTQIPKAKLERLLQALP